MSVYTKELRDTILNLLNDWKYNYAGSELQTFIEKETGLKVLNCVCNYNSFDFTISDNPNINVSLDNLDLNSIENDYFISDFSNIDEIKEQYHNLNENEFRTYMYKIFTNNYITYNDSSNLSIINPNYSSGSTFTIDFDDYWTMSMIEHFIKVYNLIIIHQNDYTIYINDEAFNENSFDTKNLKLDIIKKLIKRNLIDINTLFDKNTIEIIYTTVLHNHIAKFVQELFSNDDLREDFSDAINTTILEMIEKNELNI